MIKGFLFLTGIVIASSSLPLLFFSSGFLVVFSLSALFILRCIDKLFNPPLHNKGFFFDSHLQSYHTLNLENCSIKDIDIAALCQYLTKHPHITTVNLKGNNLHDVIAERLTDNSNRLQVIDLSFNKITNQGAKALAQHKTLSSLNLSNNKISDAGIEELAKNTTLKSLNLSHNSVKQKGLAALAQNTTLDLLTMSANYIDDNGVKLLAQNRGFKSLDLSRNKIGNIGACALAENTHVKILDVSWNHIQDRGAWSLATNTTCQSINIQFNTLTEYAKQNINSKDLTIYLREAHKKGITVATPSLKTFSIFAYKKNKSEQEIAALINDTDNMPRDIAELIINTPLVVV